MVTCFASICWDVWDLETDLLVESSQTSHVCMYTDAAVYTTDTLQRDTFVVEGKQQAYKVTLPRPV